MCNGSKYEYDVWILSSDRYITLSFFANMHNQPWDFELFICTQQEQALLLCVPFSGDFLVPVLAFYYLRREAERGQTFLAAALAVFHCKVNEASGDIPFSGKEVCFDV